MRMQYRMSRVLAIAIATVIAACGGASKPRPTSSKPPPPAAAAGPWGGPVSAPEVEARVKAWLAGVAGGHAEAPGVLSIGPGLWEILSQDAALAELGIPMSSLVTVGGEQRVLAGRAIRAEQVPVALATRALTATAEYFAEAELGPATEYERRLYYTGIAWEIAGQPITVARREGARLVVIVDDGTVMLEELGIWERMFGGPKTP